MGGKAQFEVFPESLRHSVETDAHPTGRYRWRLRAANGEPVAQGTESYRDETDARRAAHDAARTTLTAYGLATGEVDPVVAADQLVIVLVAE